jgi:hypothetical protein
MSAKLSLAYSQRHLADMLTSWRAGRLSARRSGFGCDVRVRAAARRFVEISIVTTRMQGDPSL